MRSYLSSRGVKHTDILARDYVNQFARFDVPYFDEGWLKRKNIRIVECKGLWSPLPLNFPVGPCAPAVPVDKEAEVGIVEKEFAVQTLNVNRLHILLAGNKV